VRVFDRKGFDRVGWSGKSDAAVNGARRSKHIVSGGTSFHSSDMEGSIRSIFTSA
jgi:hypothetical protein